MDRNVDDELRAYFAEVDRQSKAKGFPLVMDDFDGVNLGFEFVKDASVEEAKDVWKSVLTLSSLTLDGDNEGDRHGQTAAQIVDQILRPFDQLTSSESFPSYAHKCMLVEWTLRELPRGDMPEDIRHYLYKEAWRISLRAAWTMHQQVTIYAKRVDTHVRFPDPDALQQAKYDFSQLCYAFITWKQALHVVKTAVQLWNTLRGHPKWSLRSSQDQVLYVDTLCALFLYRGVVQETSFLFEDVFFRPNAQEEDVQLKNAAVFAAYPLDDFHDPRRWTDEARNPLAFTLPILREPSFRFPSVLPVPCTGQPSDADGDRLVAEMEAALLQLLAAESEAAIAATKAAKAPRSALITEVTSSSSAVPATPPLRDFVEALFTNAHIALAKHWDATDNCLQSDAAVAFALLQSFDALKRWARALSLGACFLTTASLMAAIPVTTRLFAERHETPPHVLSQFVLYRLLQQLLSSQVVAVADWVLPKLLQQLPVFSSEEARWLCHRCALTIVLASLAPVGAASTDVSKASATTVHALLSTKTTAAGRGPSGRPDRHAAVADKATSAAIYPLQAAGDYVEATVSLLRRERDAAVLWPRWRCLQRAVEYLPPEVTAYFAAELHEALLLALNVWHLPFQAFLLRDVLPLLLQRCPSHCGDVAEQLLTEVFRVFIFYTRRAAPDLSLASDAQVTHFASQVVAEDTWRRGLVARYPAAAGRWTDAMRQHATALQTQHATGDATIDEEEIDSCRFLLRCVQTLSPDERQPGAV